MNLYEMTLDARQKVDTYRHADIDDWVKAIDPVLQALGKAPIWRDRVDDISINSKSVTIRTSYTVRGCADSDTVNVPLAVLNADDPVKEASLCRLRDLLHEAHNEKASAERNLGYWTNEIQKFTTKLAELENNS